MDGLKRNFKKGNLFLLTGLIVGIFLWISIPSVCAISSDNKIIYDLPLFDNYGPAFSTWHGESEKPLGNALLKGKITLNNDQFSPGDTIKIILDLYFSGTIISGQYGALMTDLGYDTWMFKTDDFLEEDTELGQIKGSEYMGIGSGQEIPPIMLRNITHTYEIQIPDSAISGEYDVYAFIEDTQYQTNPVTIKIIGESSPDNKINGFTGLVFSKDFDEESGESIGITDVFSTTDDRVCALSSFDPLKSNGIIEWKWYEPSGDLYDSLSIDAEKGWDWVYSYINITGDEPELIPGYWTVDFIFDGEIIGSKQFTIKGDTLSGLSDSTETEDKSLEKGFGFYKQGDYEEAIKAFNQAITDNPKNAEALSMKGLSLNQLKKYEEAIEVFDQYIKIDPNNALVWSSKGIALYETGKYDEVVKACDQALKIEPDESIWSLKGMALSKLGKYNEAAQAFEKALEFNPNDSNNIKMRDYAISMQNEKT